MLLTPDLVDPANAWRLSPDRMAAHLEPAEFQRPPHIRYIGSKLANGFAQGDTRLIITTPPQVGKSTLTSAWFPTWAFHVTGGKCRIILASYEADYAASWGRQVRNRISRYGPELGLQLSPDSTAAKRFDLVQGGSMATAGVGGSLTGKPGDLILIDDPIKNYEDAHSLEKLKAQWMWYSSVIRTRFQPGTMVVLIMTRWHEEDLGGKLQQFPDWEVIRLPALAEADDVLGRSPGESLWEERFSAAYFAKTRSEIGEYLFSAMYQGTPSPLTGDTFNDEKWQYADAVPAGLTMVRRWDLAATAGGGDFTAGVLQGADSSGRFYVLDVINVQIEGTDAIALMRTTAESDLATYGCKTVRFEQEPGSSGKTLAKVITRKLAGFDVAGLTSTGSKLVRAIPFAAQQKGGNVFLCRAPDGSAPRWWTPYREQIRLFPNAVNDDMVDASTGGFADLLDLVKRRRAARASSSAGLRLPGR